MHQGMSVKYMQGTVFPQFDGVTFLMQHPTLTKYLMELVYEGYTVNKTEMGVIRESILTASLFYNRN